MTACAPEHPLLAPEIGEKLGTLDPISLEEYAAAPGSVPPPPAPEDPTAVVERARRIVARPPAPESLRVGLDQVRTAALTRGLELQVRLVDPSIAETVADAEAAKFDAVFGFETSAEDRSAGGVTPSTDTVTSRRGIRPSVRVPLRTGGSVEVGESLSTVDDLEDPSGRFDHEAAFGLSVVQPLLRGGGTERAHASIVVARLEARQSFARTKLAAIRTLANAEKAYWALYAAHRDLEVQVDEHRRSLEQVDLARRLVAEGALSNIEVKRALSGAARTVDRVLSAEMRRRIAERELKRVMNDDAVPVTSSTLVLPADDPAPVAAAVDRGRLVALAVGNRMELLDAEVQLAIDEVAVAVRANEALPKLDLGFRYSFDRAGPGFDDVLRDQFQPDSDARAVSLTFEWPLGNAAAEARQREAILARVRDERVRARLVAAVEQEVCDAADALEENWQRVLATRNATVLATETYLAEVAQFQAGAVTSTDVLLAASVVADAQAAEVSALRDYEDARIDLAFATGTILGKSRVVWTPASLPGR